MTKITVEIDKVSLFKIYHEAMHIKTFAKQPMIAHGAAIILEELEKAVPRLKEATPLR